MRRSATRTAPCHVLQVQAGVGRTGKWWGHQHFEGARPDIMLFAKGIGSGYPFAGMAAKPHLYDNLKPGTMGARIFCLQGPYIGTNHCIC